MRDVKQASPALQLIMRKHDSTVWETGLCGELRIGIRKKSRGNTFEFKTVTSEMLAAANRQICQRLGRGTPRIDRFSDMVDSQTPLRR